MSRMHGKGTGEIVNARLLPIGAGILCVGGLALAIDPPTMHHSSGPSHTSSTPSHTSSSHTTSSMEHHNRAEMERRARAWRDWYYHTHRRYIQPGYYYPPGYPPGYTEPTPITSTYSPGQDNTPPDSTAPVAPPPSTPAPSGAGTTAPGPDSATSPVASTPDAQPTGPIDPDLQKDVDVVKKACATRADYQAAVADKKDADEKLADLHRSESTDVDTLTTLATRSMNARRQIAAIEREETAKTAKALAAQLSAPPKGS